MSNNEFLEITPTLLVGLGGTGKLILSEIKKLMITHPFFEKKMPGMISLLAIDSDSADENLTDDKNALLKLSPDEMLTVHASISDIKEYLERKPYIKQWFPISQTRNVELSGRGAKQKRYLGRLTFYSSVEDIFETITSKFNTICNRAHLVSTGKVRMADTQNLNVFIVNSLCGGTGSGMFIDLAYLLREISLSSVSKQAMMTGIFLSSEAFHLPNFRKSLQRNCAASLMELDYFMSPNHIDFSTQYTDTIKIRDAKSKKAFDFSYIINGTNISDNTEVCKTLAHGIFSTIITSAGQKKDSVMDNIVYDSIENNEKKYTSFSTYGFGSLYFPVHDIKQAFSWRFASQLCGNITEKWDNSSSKIRLQYSDFARNTPELSSEVSSLLLDKSITKKEILKIAQNNIFESDQYGVSDIYININTWVKNSNMNEYQEKKVNTIIDTNLSKYKNSLLMTIGNIIDNQIADFDMGVGFALKFSKEIYKDLSSFISDWKSTSEGYESQMVMLQKHVTHRLLELSEKSNSFFAIFNKDEIYTLAKEIASLNNRLSTLSIDLLRLKKIISLFESISIELKSNFIEIIKSFLFGLEKLRTKIFSDYENDIILRLRQQKLQNQFVDRLIIDEQDINISSWYYDHLIFGPNTDETQRDNFWDETEKDFLKKYDFKKDWRRYSTSIYELEQRFHEYSQDHFNMLDNISIEDFIITKADHFSKSKEVLYNEELKRLYHSSKPTTATTDKRGKYNSVFTMTFGIPSTDNTLITTELLNKSFPKNEAKVNIAELGFRERIILIQTEEAIPLTAFNGIENWNSAYKTSDIYLHAIGTGLGINWSNHGLLRDSFSINVKRATNAFFLGLKLSFIQKRKDVSSEHKAYYFVNNLNSNEFNNELSEINLGDTIENSIKELCEKSDKLIMLENQLKKHPDFARLGSAEKAKMLTNYIDPLSNAIAQLNDNILKQAYNIILKALKEIVYEYEQNQALKSQEQSIENSLKL